MFVPLTWFCSPDSTISMLSSVDSKVFGRGIQESEIAELHIYPPHTDPPWYRKGRIIMSVVVQVKAQ
jgi:hypothetical protein